MLRKITGKIAALIGAHITIPAPAKDESELLAIGAMLSKQQLSMQSDRLNDYEFKIFSQWGDDGIIQYLVRNLPVKNEYFIEFGVQDFSESNTRFLMMHNNWAGFVMDGSESNMQNLRKQKWFWKYDLKHKAVFIDKENINGLLAETGMSDIGLLHIDLDGNDYYILEAIDFSRLNPTILILEYNAVFGPSRPISVPYDKDFVRTKAHYSNLFFGASLAALTHGAEKKGYALIGCNLAGNNAYYVKREMLNSSIKEVSVADAFRDSRFRESRAQDYSLSFRSGNDRLKEISGLEVVNVVTGETEVL